MFYGQNYLLWPLESRREVHSIAHKIWPALLYTLWIENMISYPYNKQQHSGKCKQLGYFSFCHVQQFIDKSLVINFHNNIFIFALWFHFFHIDVFIFIFYHTLNEHDGTVYCVCLCIVCRAFVHYTAIYPPSLSLHPLMISLFVLRQHQLNHPIACTYFVFATYLWFSLDATT